VFFGTVFDMCEWSLRGVCCVFVVCLTVCVVCSVLMFLVCFLCVVCV